MQDNKQASVRLAFLTAYSSFAVGMVVCLMVVFWQRSNPSLPAEAAVVESSVAAASGAAKGQAGGKPSGQVVPRGAEGVVRPASTVTATGRAADARMAAPQKAPTPPAQTAANTIQGPFPWRRNGPPVRTPAPGQAGARPPQVTVLGRVASPDGTHRNVPGQSLPFLLPARSRPTPAPASTQPKGRGTD